MADDKKRRRGGKTSVWLVIIALVLIALLIIWLTIADLWGDTDVAAQATGAFSGIGNLLTT